ncbi:Metal-dependent hydrolase YbeY, involved in rRNA and/or ribosome maturation and assembly [hydrothermal vent metagenome]|uniref:Metal-dependent hydrolase YbeY, involved in rRNA and/or ribosome maturation and assembly n=1 Tax=hydrothermal vent metagenome TaxID=652676 RepID=A0A3B0UN71_9ZZZZ
MKGLTIRNLTRQAVLGSLFVKASKKILPSWEVSLVFIGEVRAKRLNKDLRGKTYTPNVLSYALNEKHGEIFICPKSAEKQASEFGLSLRDFMLLLFIHGLLHLKGYRHGTTMERYERKVLTQIVGT